MIWRTLTALSLNILLEPEEGFSIPLNFTSGRKALPFYHGFVVKVFDIAMAMSTTRVHSGPHHSNTTVFYSLQQRYIIHSLIMENFISLPNNLAT